MWECRAHGLELFCRVESFWFEVWVEGSGCWGFRVSGLEHFDSFIHSFVRSFIHSFIFTLFIIDSLVP